jgi:hypothetical protein
MDDFMELAYYNILAGCCFVNDLKYTGTEPDPNLTLYGYGWDWQNYLLAIRLWDVPANDVSSGIQIRCPNLNVHVLGAVVLCGGRYTLDTSDAAIVRMVIAIFPPIPSHFFQQQKFFTGSSSSMGSIC